MKELSLNSDDYNELQKEYMKSLTTLMNLCDEDMKILHRLSEIDSVC